MDYFICKHWWEIPVKLLLFNIGFIVVEVLLSIILVGIMHFNPSYFDGEGWYGIWLSPFIFIYCLYTYLKNVFKKR